MSCNSSDLTRHLLSDGLQFVLARFRPELPANLWRDVQLNLVLVRRGLTAALGLLAAYALWTFLGSLWAPDACLDQEGSFNYRTWECSQDQQPYLETPLYNVPGFWFALVSLLIAIGFSAWARRHGRKDSTF